MLNLPANLEAQINQLANQAGQPVDLFLDALISDYLEDKNDVIEADAIYKRIQAGQEATVTFAQLLKDNGLDN